ncbi:MAG: hypothetical protein IN808_11615 [Rubrobacter sp.]|nr:hypothetical protein [Rubrobacter sp.]
MWVDAFATLKGSETLAGLMLRDEIPLFENGTRLKSTMVERACGVLGERLLVHTSRGKRERLVFLVPGATQSLGRYVAVALLLADLVHRSGRYVAKGEEGKLLHGDVLLVTQHIRRCTELLRGLRLRSYRLSDYWQIEVLSKYSRPDVARPRVFVVNPGWKMSTGKARRFGCVIVDASHPRTAAHLERLMAHPDVRTARAQVLVIPPWDDGRVSRLLEEKELICRAWAWDPVAADAVERADFTEPLPRGASEVEPPTRTLWVCEDKPVDEALWSVHKALVGALRIGGRIPPTLFEAWSVYHRLRQLAVPLLQAEEERQRAYGTLTVRERLRSLKESQATGEGALGAYLDVRWAETIEKLEEVYSLLMQRKEPAKFYALATVVDDLLTGSRPPAGLLRIVAPTEHEGNLLATLLGDVVEDWTDALQEGVVSLSTVREEPRLIAEGQAADTVLLGFRTSESRYLDVYPDCPVHVVAYPYEAPVDEGNQRRAHAFMERLQDDGCRSAILRELLPPATVNAHASGRASAAAGANLPITPRARVSLRTETGTQPRLVRRAEAEVVEPLDLGGLAGAYWADEIVVGTGDRSPSVGAERRRSGRLVEVLDEEGDRVFYPESHLLDVYFPATERLDRVAAKDLRPGMLMVVLVDDRYDDLFKRLLEAMEEQRDLRASLTLAHWGRAKQAALAKHGGSRRRLHEELERRGLSVDYEAVVGYYARGKKEIMAPERFEDFELLARASGMYTDPQHLERTFECIRAERENRRRYGRRLRRLLRQLVGGAHYQAALESAEVLGTPVEEVAAAVALREVRDIGRPGLPSGRGLEEDGREQFAQNAENQRGSS